MTKCKSCHKPITWDNGLDEWFHTERIEEGENAIFCEGDTGRMANP